MEKSLINKVETNIETLSTLDVGIVNINYTIGAAHDGVPTGTAHFLEHIICSTHNFSHGKLTAQTQRDETNYYLYVSKNNIEPIFKNLNWQISIDKTILEQERNTIRNEIKQFNITLRNRALEYLQFLLFDGKGYGRSILGNEKQISQMNKFELVKGIEFYKRPKSINIIGPWKTEYIMDSLSQSNLMDNSGETSSVNNSTITIGRGEKSLPEEINIPFIGGAWFLNINKSVQIHIAILKSIWETRIREFYPSFFLRIHLYNHGGILTLDSTSVKADQSDIKKIIMCMELPISIQEFQKSLIKQYITYHRLSEDLQTRINGYDYRSLQKLSSSNFPEIQEFQKNLLNHVSYRNGLYLLSDRNKNNISYFPIKKLNIQLSKNNAGNLRDDLVENKNIHLINNLPLIIRKKNFYYALSSSPLTNRYHLLIRIDCIGIGRLMLPNELPSELLIKGTLENVRYEGWHTLYQISFFDENSMRESIKKLLTYRWIFKNKDSNINEEMYMKNMEIEMKRRIIKAFNYPTIKTKGYLIGLSILTPEGINLNKDFFKDLSPVEIQPLLLIEEILIENKIITARFQGAAIICRLPKKNLCSLILQETAFGSNTIFSTLESIVRKKGLSYRIVQSLISIENELYIFWGIQCDINSIGLFKDLVREWMFNLEKHSNEVENWFKNMWAYYNPQNHNSISQLIRDIDRMGQYTKSNDDINIDFKEFINNIMLEELTEITFAK